MSTFKVRDARTKEIVDVSLDDLGPLVASGQYQLPLGKSIPVIDPDGNLGEIASEQYTQALKSGYAPATTSDIQKQIDVETYGDSPLQTGAERAASAVTFGATDLLARAVAPAYADSMQKREELNPTAAVVGEIAGTVGPALLSAGVSMAGKAGVKAAQAVAPTVQAAVSKTPVAIADKIGTAVSKKVASMLPSNTLAKKVVADIVPRAAGMGVEGALYGAGNYISDASLGNVDLSAEAALSEIGMAAFLGAGIGGAIGGVKVVGAPIIKKITGFGDVEKIAKEFTGTDTVRGGKIYDKGIKPGEVARAIVDDAKIGLKVMDDAETIIKKTDDFLERTGTQIDDVLTSLETQGEKVLPRVDSLQKALNDKLDEMLKTTKTPAGTAVAGSDELIAGINKVKEEIAAQFEGRNMAAKVTVPELQTTRQFMDRASKWDKNAPSAVKPGIYRELRGVLRGSIDDVAEKAGGDVAQKLKSLNRDYHVGASIQPHIEREVIANSNKSFLNLRDLLTLGVGNMSGVGTLANAYVAGKKMLQSQLGQNAQLIYAVKAAERKTDKAINDSLRSFFLNVGKGVKASTLKLSTDAKEYDSYTKQVEKFANNPDEYLKHVNNRNVAASQQMPMLTAATEAKGLLAMQFLASKMPKSKNAPGLIPRPYMPSTQERAKFMRYAEIVENPRKAFEHLQNGTLTKENVEALKAVYPEMYKTMAGKAAEYLSKYGTQLPYNKKLQVGILLGIPVDSSMNPKFIKNMQAGFVPSANSSMIQPGITGASKLNKAGRYNGDSGL